MAEISGKPIQSYKPEELSRYVGSVFQNPRSQFFNMDSTSEIAFGCENIGVSREEIHKRIHKATKDLCIERLLDRNVFTLSNGEKQMLAIASSYAMEPDIFVMDEPSANLDAFASEQLGQVIARLKELGKTIIIAEHRFHFMKGIPDRILYLKEGRISHEWKESEFNRMSIADRRLLGLRSYDLKDVLLNTIPSVVQNKKETLSLQNLSVGYGKKNPVIRSVDYNAQGGEVIAIIGKNGHGKTTLAKCLCGLMKESEGEVLVNKTKVSCKNRIGKFYLVMQDPNYQLFSDTVEGEMSISLQKKSPLGAEEKANILATLSLDSFIERHPLSLSGGEKQRLTIATSIVQDAKTIFLDEPTSGLDYENMMRVRSILQWLQEKGRTIFIITHDYELIVSTCNRILHMEDGTIREDYKLDETSVSKLQNFFTNNL